MNIILVELVKSGILLGLLAYLLRITFKHKANNNNGWGFIVLGFILLFFGSLVAIVGIYPRQSESFLSPNSTLMFYLESIAYISGFALLAAGLLKWLPGVRDALEIKKNTRKNSAPFQQIADLLPGLISAKDENGAFLFANLAFKKAYGTRGQTLARKVKPILSERYEETNGLSEAERKTLQSSNHKFIPLEQITDLDGNIRFLQTIQIPFQLVESNTPALLSMSVDITERKHFEQQLDHLQNKLDLMNRTDAVDDLSMGIGHDFNSALSGIMLAARLLKKPDKNLDARSLEFADLIISTSERAIDLSNKAFAHTTEQDDQPKMIDIVNLIQQAVTLLDEEMDQNILIANDCHTKNATVIGNSAALLKVFTYLGLKNAYSTPKANQIAFTLNTKQLKQAFCDNSAFDITAGRFIEIAIHYSGTDKQQDTAQIIFDNPYAPHAYNGNEFGEIYKIIHKHKGAIVKVNDNNEDSLFVVYLPLLTAQK
jgi:PAS domain S-box-containing protein